MTAERAVLDAAGYPVEAWALVETRCEREPSGHAETLFAVGNGYLGMRGNVDEGREAHEHGTYINGFHETFPIHHAEEAFGFAKVGQTILNVPDAKVIRLYVDDEPFSTTTAELLSYERRLDFRAGELTRDLVWRTPAGKRVRVRSRRLVSFTQRHLALLEYEVELLDADASVVISTQLLNRQNGVDEYAQRTPAQPESFDPRNAERLEGQVLLPKLQRERGDTLLLGYQTRNSRMTLTAAVRHEFVVEGEADVLRSAEVGAEVAKHVYRARAKAGCRMRLTKFVAYHTAHGVPASELADRCLRTLDRAADLGVAAVRTQQREWLDDFWEASDVTLHGHPELQQALRFDLFQVAQAGARADGLGIAAKGVSGSGYSGHYFWDTEIFVMPFMTYTQPTMARNALRFRVRMLDHARERAKVLNEHGALFPWRTINGQESSAYYAAGTAQYHIDADIAHALSQYLAATGDLELFLGGGIDVLIETARMWYDLGFWRANGNESFHIQGVTGPDEYTTVVNDNLFTNVMAQENLRIAAESVEWLREQYPGEYREVVDRLGLEDAEPEGWRRAAAQMCVPYDPQLGVHPQDDAFLDKEIWDLENTPESQRPLLLHFHPLVIYRFQVIKQADVVLALFLRGDLFTAAEKLADFEYYDVLTTADSSLSAPVQSIIAAEVGHMRLAEKYFRQTLFTDLGNLYGNADVGVHVAACGAAWLDIVCGFVGMRDHAGEITFDPRLPDGWDGIDARLLLRGATVHVALRPRELTFTVLSGPEVVLRVRGESVRVRQDAPVTVPLPDQGPRVERELSMDTLRGWHRADGTRLTASVPPPLPRWNGADEA